MRYGVNGMKKYNEFWDRVQFQLNKKVWSLQKLSATAQIPVSTLEEYKYHAVNPPFSKVCKIADALNVSLDELRIKEK